MNIGHGQEQEQDRKRWRTGMHLRKTEVRNKIRENSKSMNRTREYRKGHE
jgi:hypothetical protein